MRVHEQRLGAIHHKRSLTPEAVPVVEKYILKAAFRNQCKWILQEQSSRAEGTSGLQIQPRAIDALQQSAEQYLVQFFNDARLAMLQRVRSRKGRGEGELQLVDLQLARRLDDESDTGGSRRYRD